jgi:hypothetical protein
MLCCVVALSEDGQDLQLFRVLKDCHWVNNSTGTLA